MIKAILTAPAVARLIDNDAWIPGAILLLTYGPVYVALPVCVMCLLWLLRRRPAGRLTP
jgi:hypothetical protein